MKYVFLHPIQMKKLAEKWTLFKYIGVQIVFAAIETLYGQRFVVRSATDVIDPKNLEIKYNIFSDSRA